MFLGMPADDHNNSVNWPSGLPIGWSMEWEPSTIYGSDELYHVWAYHEITPTTLCIFVFYFPLQNFFLILCFYKTSLVSFGIKLVQARASAC